MNWYYYGRLAGCFAPEFSAMPACGWQIVTSVPDMPEGELAAVDGHMSGQLSNQTMVRGLYDAASRKFLRWAWVVFRG